MNAELAKINRGYHRLHHWTRFPSHVANDTGEVSTADAGGLVAPSQTVASRGCPAKVFHKMDSDKDKR